MNNQQIGILTIIKSALLNEPFALPEDFDIEKAAKAASSHQITALFYYGALNCGISGDLPAMKKMFMHTCSLAAASEQQVYSINELLAEFDDNKIDYMPLKGVNLKKLYPKNEMRIMSDADILIRTEQYDRIKPIMVSLGYTEKCESDHELIWEKHGVCIELHKRIIPSYNEDYYAYFGDGWRLGMREADESTRYVMSTEDEMIYLFTHFAKHYRTAGIGLKHIIDLWVYKNANQLNEDYLFTELTKLQLCAFYKNTMRTIDACFESAESDEVTEAIIQTVFDSGVYGTHEAYVLSGAVKKLKKTKNSANVRKFSRLSAVFMPYSKMCDKYHILRKVPILLPFMWVVRWLDALLFKRDHIKQRSADLKTMSDEKIENYQQSLNFVGLDFNFKE